MRHLAINMILMKITCFLSRTYFGYVFTLRELFIFVKIDVLLIKKINMNKSKNYLTSQSRSSTNESTLSVLIIDKASRCATRCEMSSDLFIDLDKLRVSYKIFHCEWYNLILIVIIITIWSGDSHLGAKKGIKLVVSSI